mgnify:CR=1 FL=1
MTTAQRLPTAHLEQTDRLQIPGASSYEIDIYGFVYRRGKRNRTAKRIQLQRKGAHWHAQIYSDAGKRVNFDSERLARILFGEDEPELRRQDIERNFNIRTVPGFPRYAVTPYGAVYCVDPPKRGRNAGQCYLLKETLSRNKPYVNLYRADGTKRKKQVAWVVKSAWGGLDLDET